MIALTIIALSGIAAGVGTIISKKRYDNKINKMASTDYVPIIVNGDAMQTELDTFERFQKNLLQVRTNLNNVDVPITESLSKNDDGDSAMKKLSRFFDKHSIACAGTEAFVLNVLPHVQVIDSLSAAATFLTGTVKNSVQQGVHTLAEHWSFDNGTDILHNFAPALKMLAKGIEHGGHINYAKLFGEASGAKDAIKASVSSLKDSAHEAIGADSFHNITDNLTDFGDVASVDSIDPSGFDVSSSAHVPIITIGISAFREIGLLCDEKTDGLTALKNLSLDVAGTGAGGLLGGKAGAAIGTLICPGIGTLIGGLLGSVGGAMGGRSITNNIKQKPLRDAIDAYQRKIDQMKRETGARSKEMYDDISSYAEERRNEFQDKRDSPMPVNASKDIVLGIAMSLFTILNDYIESMEKSLKKMKNSIWYSEEKHGEILETFTEQIYYIRRQMPSRSMLTSEPSKAIKCLNEVRVPESTNVKKYVNQYARSVDEFKKLNDTNNSSLLTWIYSVAFFYKQMMNSIATYSNEKMELFNRFVESWKANLKPYESAVNVEKDKLGL